MLERVDTCKCSVECSPAHSECVVARVLFVCAFFGVAVRGYCSQSVQWALHVLASCCLRVRDGVVFMHDLTRVRRLCLARREHKYAKLAIMLSYYTPGASMPGHPFTFVDGRVEHIAAEIAGADAFLAGGTDPLDFPEKADEHEVKQFFTWADRDEDGVVNRV